MLSKSYKRLAARSVLACAAAVLVGCASVGNESYIKVRPRTEVVRTTTSFSGALRCMDDLFTSRGVHSVPVTTIGIPDATGKVRSGIRDMLITSIAQMSEHSGAFKYVDWEYESKELQVLFQQVRDSDRKAFETQYENPRYYIRGAVTQFDQNVVDNRYGGGVAGQYQDYAGDVFADWSANASVVALDMNVGDILTRKIVPGLSSNNSIAIDQRGGAVAGALSNNDLGLTLDFESTQAEGVHVAIRTLVELGSIETLGKLTRVPYWRCLQIESTAPGVLREMEDWWRDMSEEERNLFAERTLVRSGYLAGPADEEPDAASREAIARYQAEKDLVVSGRVNFQLYTRLIGDDRPVSAGPPELDMGSEETLAPPVDARELRESVQIELFTDRGSEPSYAPMEFLHANVQVSGNAYVYCYYQDGAGDIARVFPNRFQSDPRLAAGEIVTIPGREAGFQIQIEGDGPREEVICLASDREIANRLPVELHGYDLVPMPVESLDEIARAFFAIDRAIVSQARLPISVAGM